MELDELIIKHNIKKRSFKCYEEYMKNYKLEDPNDYEDLFLSKNINEVELRIHSIAYVINCYFDKDIRYLASTIRLIYDDIEFAEYKVFFNLHGEIEDDYLIEI
ncbi:hypothetical protein KHQ81_00585 [Mycoplasmatota bacterium]|nr:hypothetical protein KHQ81_00585 [Mycoplasmatota bacterium]